MNTGRMGESRGRAVGAAPGRRPLDRRVLVSLLAGAALSFACLAWSAPALALVQRGHVFGSTFEGTGEHAFTQATGVAVNDATGEVYVVDAGHERVERFKPSGGEYEFVSEFAVPGPEGIAIDNDVSSPSHGEVYVAGVEKAPKKGEQLEAGAERNFVYKFTATGEKIYKKQIFKGKEKVVNESGESVSEEFEVELEKIAGVAVDATGKLWVYWEEEGYVAGFTSDEKNRLIGTSIKEEVTKENFECRSLPGFAVGPADEAFYLRHERGNGLEECLEEEVSPNLVAHALVGKIGGSGAPLAGGLDNEDSTGVAVDETSGAVYVDNLTSVAAFAADGAAIQRFGSGNLSGGGPLAVDAATDQVFVAEGAGDRIAVFVPEEAGARPSIDSLSAQDLTPTSSRLSATIDPHGSDTHYYFQYGVADCVATPGSCTDVPLPAPGADLGSGFGDQSVEVTLEGLQPDTSYHYRVVAQNANGVAESNQSTSTFFTTLPSSAGLLPDGREWQMVSPPLKGGALQAMSMEGAAIQASEGGGAITYGAEASGPVGEPQGNRSIAVTQFLSTRGSSEWSTEDIVTPHNKGEGVTTGGGETEEYRVFSSDLSVGLVEPEVRNQEPIENPPLSPPLKAGEVQEKTMYLRADAPVTPGEAEKKIYEEAAANSEYLSPGYLALVSGLNATSGEPFGKGLEFLDATPDLNHVVFESAAPLVSGAAGEGLYEWSSNSPQHALKLISLPPPEPGAPAVSAPKLGSYGNSRGAVSNDGSRVVFSSEFEGNEGAFLFLREPGKSETVQINAAQGERAREPGAAERESEELDEARFQTASADGSKILFTDTWPLTDDSRLHPTEASHPADLYQFDASTRTLVDLTAVQNAGESANVLGTIPGSSEDGSYVYFVANGVLAPGATRGHCPQKPPFEESEVPADATCNLYVSAPSAGDSATREIRLIATVSARDGADWDLPMFTRVKGHDADLTYLTSRVSPGSGEYLAFMSQRSLTGYDNRDAVSSALDEEVFLYNAKAGRLVCASCNPGGARPHGVFDTRHAGEGAGLLVDRPEVWNERWLAGSIPGWTALSNLRSTYQSRYLSRSGRLFFDSADPLVSQDANQKEDVYEYQPEGVGSCSRASGCVALISSGVATDTRESAFLDASANGGDAFFLTSEKLLAPDTDSELDVYDASICGTSETAACLPVKVPPAPPCTGEACKAPVSSQPAFSSPATATFSGPGNMSATSVLGAKSKTPTKAKALTRAQKLSKALKGCRSKYKHNKKRRSACEKRARKSFGVKKAAKTRSKARKSSLSSGRRR